MNGATRGERHLATIVVLNFVFGLVMLAAGVWLINSANQRADLGTTPVHAIAGGICFGAAALGLALSWGLRRGWRFARLLQFAVAIGLLPILPLGTAWGGYVLWALRVRNGDASGRRSPVQPFYAGAMPAVFAGVALLTFGLLKANEWWLSRRIDLALTQEESQRLAVDRSFERLHDLSADDLAAPGLRVAGTRPRSEK